MYVILGIRLGNGVKDRDDFYVFNVIGYRLIDLYSSQCVNVSLDEFNGLYGDCKIYSSYRYLDSIKTVKLLNRHRISIISNNKDLNLDFSKGNIPYQFIVEQSIDINSLEEHIVIKPKLRYTQVFCNVDLHNIRFSLFVDNYKDRLMLHMNIIIYTRYYRGYSVCYDLLDSKMLGSEDSIEYFDDVNKVFYSNLIRVNRNISEDMIRNHYGVTDIAKEILCAYFIDIDNGGIIYINDKICILTSDCRGDVIVPNGFETVIISIVNLGTEDYEYDVDSIVFPPTLKNVIIDSAGFENIKAYLSNRIPKDVLQDILCSMYHKDKVTIDSEFLKLHNIEMY